MTLSFMIKKKYLAEKVAEQEETGTFHERRAYKPFWRTRIGSVYKWGPRKGRTRHEAVFICGRHAWRADILNITLDETPDAYIVVAGQICYNIECKFHQEELKWLLISLS